MAVPVGALCGCALLDPERPAGWIFCPFRLVTGIACPLCGMTRGLASLLRGRWGEGVGYHLFSPLVLGAAVAWIVVEAGHGAGVWDGRGVGRWVLRPAPWVAFISLCTIYGALRWCGILGGPVV